MLVKVKEFCKVIFERCMVEPDVNSRFVFLIGSLGTMLGMGALIIAFICAKNKEAYPAMIVAVSGGSVAQCVGRYMTKKNSTAPTSDKTDAPSETEGK